jgi:ATP-dependent RNA helicase SUPV3L1/SUV3
MLEVMSPVGVTRAPGRITAVLGPTNTGKTHFAVERMLGHRNGIIGLPLRLLAREIYDRVHESVGRSHVALVTGEEKIVPANPDYFVCTVEAMPMERRFAFVAIDEIQLAADAERGHVFTDRLLRARGSEETIFLGADTIRPIIKRLVPNCQFISRPRFSTLTFSGQKKLSRLPKRSAVVSFSAPDVYATAELIRRFRGGAAVVLGALSPRTRNAQVAMFEAGEVDYLVATDAVGMGLNLNVDHVAFAGLKKFDGITRRDLTPAEISQIAGRAGRHMSNGTFGTTSDAGSLSADTIRHVENHQFGRVRTIQWRNVSIDVTSPNSLLASLDAPPPVSHQDVLSRTPNADDYLALKALVAEPDILSLAKGRAAVNILWEVCQIPDFRKTMAEAHARLLGRVYTHIMSPAGVLPTDWVADHIARLDRMDGDIDTLATRIAHVRTWTYISHRGDWLSDAPHWQERARAVEDGLSDALHERLTQRFVDQRTAALIRRVHDDQKVYGHVNSEGNVQVEGHSLGNIDGLRFIPDPSGSPSEGRALRAAAKRIVAREINTRANLIAVSSDEAITLRTDLALEWKGTAVAQLTPGNDPLQPGLSLFPMDLQGEIVHRLERRLRRWLRAYIDQKLEPLANLAVADVSPNCRGILFQLRERLGLLRRAHLESQINRLTKSERAELRGLGIRLGALSIFLPAMLQSERSELASGLWLLSQDQVNQKLSTPAPKPSAAAGRGVPSEFYAAAGYLKLGRRVIRADVAERLNAAVHRQTKKSMVAESEDLMAMAGCADTDFARVMRDLGYRDKPKSPGVFIRSHRASAKRRTTPNKKPVASLNPDSPFAVLHKLAVTADRRGK